MEKSLWSDELNLKENLKELSVTRISDAINIKEPKSKIGGLLLVWRGRGSILGSYASLPKHLQYENTDLFVCLYD
jgi:hypothetical protein